MFYYLIDTLAPEGETSMNNGNKISEVGAINDSHSHVHREPLASLHELLIP